MGNRNNDGERNPIVDWAAAGIAVLALMMVLLSSCSPKVVRVPVEINSSREHTDSVRVTAMARDTVLRSDTVCITLSEKGDTVRLVQTHWRERVKLRMDTIVRERVDSVYREVPVEVETIREVPRKRRLWEKILLGLGMLVIAGAGVWSWQRF